MVFGLQLSTLNFDASLIESLFWYVHLVFFVSLMTIHFSYVYKLNILSNFSLTWFSTYFL
jgi:hypothetical protein